jgi:hypothetical protein
MAWQSGAVERLHGFPSPDLLLRMLMPHVARGYSLRQTVVRANLAKWTDISDVALFNACAIAGHGCVPCVSSCFGETGRIRSKTSVGRSGLWMARSSAS